MQEEADVSDFEVDMDTEEEATPLKKKSKYGPLLALGNTGVAAMSK